jgi:RNAse (barnase) inhibitor barstar
MEGEMDFETALQMKPENGLYWLNSTLSRDRLEEIARKSHDNFYYIDGKHVTDPPSFFDALTQTYEWPVPGGSNWDAIFDVITEPRYYEPQNKGVIVFDQCHHLAKADAESFNFVVTVFRFMPERFEHYLLHHSMKDRDPYQVCSFLRGDEGALRVLSAENLPIPAFIRG